SARTSPRSSATMLDPSLTTSGSIAWESRGAGSGRRPLLLRSGSVRRAGPLTAGAPRVGRYVGARIGHRLQALRQGVHDHLRPPRVAVTGLTAEAADLHLRVAQNLIQERDVEVRRDVARAAR